MKKKKFNGVEYQIGLDNIFADLGIANPEEALVKAQLTLKIAKIIK